MKKLILLLICLCISENCFAEKAVLRGLVVLQNSNGQSVSGAQISAFDANAQTSDSSGRFELVFAANKKAGDKVVLSVQKQELEVVNRKELDVIIPANPDDVVKIVMCKQGERDKHALQYYEIAKDTINRSYEKQLKLVNEKYEKSLKEKNEAIRTLKAQKEAGLSQAKDLADKFAEVNLDDASELYKEAFALFQKGEVDKAIQVLEDEKMDKLLKAAQDEKRKAQERLAKSEEAVRKCTDNYILKGRMCKSRFQFDEAEKNYRKAVEADSNNLGYISEFGKYLYQQNKHSHAIILYEKARSLAKDDSDIAKILNNLGVLYSDINQYCEAKKVYNKAFEILEKLAEQNPKTYLTYLGGTLNNLGELYRNNRKYAEAENAYNKALEIFEKLAKQNSDIYLSSLATIANNLGELYRNNGKYTEAENAYDRALEVRKKLAEQNPDAYLPDLAMTFRDLGGLYAQIDNFINAEKAFNDALGIYERLSKQNPRAFEIPLCETLMNIGLFQADLFEKESKQAYKTKALSYAERAIYILSKYPDVPQAQEYMKTAIELKQQLENTPVK